MSLQLERLETDKLEPQSGESMSVLGALGALDTQDAAVRVKVKV